jgi:hypothetical protein
MHIQNFYIMKAGTKHVLLAYPRHLLESQPYDLFATATNAYIVHSWSVLLPPCTRLLPRGPEST